jgi:hypothetical protein
MRHFDDSLNLLACPPRDLKPLLSAPAALPFLRALLARLADDAPRTLGSTPDALLTATRSAHTAFRAARRRLALALRVFLCVRARLVAFGQLDEDGGVPRILGPALRGHLVRETKFLADELQCVASRLFLGVAMLNRVATSKAAPETADAVRADLLVLADEVPNADADSAALRAELGALDAGARALARWLVRYCSTHIVDVAATPLADVWLMSAPFPSEVRTPDLPLVPDGV